VTSDAASSMVPDSDRSMSAVSIGTTLRLSWW
jgi:hypothetical protein